MNTTTGVTVVSDDNFVRNHCKVYETSWQPGFVSDEG